MQAVQMKFQKILITGCLALAGIMVLYALGFSTNLYSLSYHIDQSSKMLYVPGAELYVEAQPFNHAFFFHAVYYFLTSLLLVLSLTHRRRLYYLSNYITSVVFAGFSAFLGWELLVHALEYRKTYLETVDFERLLEVTQMLRMRYVESTVMLDLGVVLSILLFAVACALVVNLILKTRWMRLEHWAEEGTP